MCLNRSSFVEANVYRRLVEHGVKPERAAGVARKVRRRYEAKNEQRFRDRREEAQRRTC